MTRQSKACLFLVRLLDRPERPLCPFLVRAPRRPSSSWVSVHRPQAVYLEAGSLAEYSIEYCFLG